MELDKKRTRTLGTILLVGGLTAGGVGLGYGVPTALDGLDSVQHVYEAQGITLSYNEDGQLVDRGTPEGAQETIDMMVDEWDFPLNYDNLDPEDPLVNTRDELMYQFATITKHVLHGTVDVTLTAEDVPIEYRGVIYTEPGTYEIEVGDYYANFNRRNVIEAQLRNGWSDKALALTASLSAGHANQAAGELALATSLATGGLGLLFAATGGGLIYATMDKRERKKKE